MNEKKCKGTCFVLMPFQPIHDWIFRDWIRPLVEDNLNLTCRKADDLYSGRPIIDDIWRAIHDADLIIVDVTKRNANVMYEVGLAHAWDKRVILLCQDIDDVPFDLRHLRIVKYEPRPSFEEKFKSDFIPVLKKAPDILPYKPPGLSPEEHLAEFPRKERPRLVLKWSKATDDNGQPCWSNRLKNIGKKTAMEIEMRLNYDLRTGQRLGHKMVKWQGPQQDYLQPDDETCFLISYNAFFAGLPGLEFRVEYTDGERATKYWTLFRNFKHQFDDSSSTT